MYGYVEYIEITTEQILQKVTQEQIFEFVFGKPFSYHDRYLSPFRDDKKPGCRFDQREDGTIVFIDFGERFLTGRTHRTCFRAVMDKFGCDLTTCIKIVCSKLGLSTNIGDYSPVKVTPASYNKPESQEVSIGFTKRPAYNKSDILHWSKFLIRSEELLSDSVYSISSFAINSSKGFRAISTYKNAYAIDFIHQVKIYQPYSTKYKWISTCDENCIGNIDNLPSNGDILVIQKSYKDHRVLRNLGVQNVIWFQNEGCMPSEEIIINLLKRFKLVIIFFDSDEHGVKAAGELRDKFNFMKPGSTISMFLPESTGCKDPAELIYKEGRRDTVEVLQNMGLYGTDTQYHT